jgi:redox-sensitive bicupin YhaK (pirin superfamily)
MIAVRRANERGHADHGWLNTYHTFSFADYLAPDHMGFRALRVINEDRVSAGKGFGMHGHRDMEIFSYVLEGELEHKDSLGNGAVLRPGEFQRISAGKGITHSEFNPSAKNATHFYQIWLLPERRGLEPGYAQKHFDPEGRRNQWQLVASRDGKVGSLPIHQDANIYLADVTAAKDLLYTIPTGRYVWLQVLRGALRVDELLLGTSDAIAVSEEKQLLIRSENQAEVMLFDLA